jgi:hypothetical protein
MLKNAMPAVVAGFALLVAWYFLFQAQVARNDGSSLSLLPDSEYETLSLAGVEYKKNTPDDLQKTFPKVTQADLRLVSKLLKSKYDADQDLNSDFSEASPELKKLLQEAYYKSPREDLRLRGAIVFLLGNNINSADDLKFFQEVMSESSCLSLSDCNSLPKKSKKPQTQAKVALHHPKLLALASIEKIYQNKTLKKELRQDLKSTLELAIQTNEPRIASHAQNLLKRLRQ